MDKLTAGLPRAASDAGLLPATDGTMEAHYAVIPTSNVQASMIFRSGTVRIHSGKTQTNTIYDSDSRRFATHSSDVFNLPEAAVWCEYQGTPAGEKSSSSEHRNPALLLFRSTVYSSQNTLRPSLLPFLTETVRRLDERLNSTPVSHPAVLGVPISPSINEAKAPFDPSAGALSRLHISFGLRIDKSKLELTCQPDVNVLAGLYWESGGFVVNISPGARKVSIAGTVDGLVTSLKHGYLSEHCVLLDARNLVFSVSYLREEIGAECPMNSISIVLDTELSGSLRFSRLQDLLCFKAVWLDRIPILGGEDIQSGFLAKTSGPSLSESPRNSMTVAVLFRSRHLQLQVDLGQSIALLTLTLDTVLFRSQLAGEKDELSFSVEQLQLLGTGNLSGHLKTSDSHFQTIRRRQGITSSLGHEIGMLELTLSSGPLDILLLSDEQWLLQYR